MIKNCMDDMLEKLGKDFAEFAGTINRIERTETGEFIVPLEVMQAIVKAVEGLFGTVHDTHVSVQTVLANELIPKEQAWSRLLEDADEGTEH